MRNGSTRRDFLRQSASAAAVGAMAAGVAGVASAAEPAEARGKDWLVTEIADVLEKARS